jgi:hypothetical protein
MYGGRRGGPGERPAAWPDLRSAAGRLATGLRAPAAGGPGLCAVCWAPVRPGYARCFQCQLHAESFPGGPADVAVPVAYAVKGSGLARDLWLYKSARDGAAAAQAALRALLLTFLHGHGRCVRRRAGMPPPTHLCVVPSGRGRPGPHPLEALIAPYIAVPRVSLAVQGHDHRWVRDLDPDRFRLAQPLPGAAVLLLDDTWASGGSVQSASAALRRAGARWVAAVVIGRHLAPAQPAGAPPAGVPLRLNHCAVHGAGRSIIRLDR